MQYTLERRAFGKRIAEFQNTQFKLAELATEVEIGQAFVDKLLAAHVRGEKIVTEVSMAKWWTTDLQKRLSGQCLQRGHILAFTEDLEREVWPPLRQVGKSPDHHLDAVPFEQTRVGNQNRSLRFDMRDL